MSTEIDNYENEISTNYTKKKIDINFSLYLCTILQSRLKNIKSHIENDTLETLNLKDELHAVDEYYEEFKEYILTEKKQIIKF